MRTILSLFRRREGGQVLVIAALLLPVLLAMVGMAIDVGTYASDRRALQNAADAMALAAGQELPDSTAATAAALALADDHDVDPADVDVVISGGNSAPSVRVVIDRSHEFSFMQIVGIDSRDVGAVAAAGLFSPGGGEGIVPWSITQDTVDAAQSGQEVVIKYDSNSTDYGQGNFGAVRFDGNGGSDYEDSIKYGADANVCSDAMPNCTTAVCPGTYPTTCSESAPECDGPECPPKTGNMTGPTGDATDFRMNNTGAACDTFEETFSPAGAYSKLKFEIEQQWQYASASDGSGGRMFHHGSGSHPTYTPTPAAPTNTPAATSTPVPTNTPGPPTNTPPAGATNTPQPTNTPPVGGGGEYILNPNCNPWSGGRCTSNSDNNCSRRVFLIPIVDEFGNGSSDPVTIKGFALVYLEGYDSGKCSGNSCEINARFVKAEVTTNAFAAAYDPDSGVHFVRLTE